MGSYDLRKLSVGSGAVKHTMLPEVERENSWSCPSLGRYWSMDKRGRRNGLLRMISLNKKELGRNQITEVKSLQKLGCLETWSTRIKSDLST